MILGGFLAKNQMPLPKIKCLMNTVLSTASTTLLPYLLKSQMKKTQGGKLMLIPVSIPSVTPDKLSTVHQGSLSELSELSTNQNHSERL